LIDFEVSNAVRVARDYYRRSAYATYGSHELD